MEAWLKDYNNIFQLQEEFLLSLLNKFKDTAIGKERGYASIKSIEQFQEQTPIQHYSNLKPYIDRTVAGGINIFHPEPPICWIQTSGTTGAPKLFPYNQDFIKNWFSSSSAITNCFIYRVGYRALKILEGEAFLIHASGDCGTIGTGATQKPLQIIHLPAEEFDRYILTKTKAGEWNSGQMKLPHLTDRQDFIRFFQSKGKGVSKL
ncbi:MAG: GH3 auxin-responsive promoter family protein [Hydrococcus sp. C42_A2020_068]|uniref:GH3 family domain-containing protein n=1 Tax=Pleurocapsa sp. PCC 7327 TaxID=118163 RepID=UPI00029FEFAC|nr:GH3 auxin-responsive promoter family protein [Pleurocapsa sp. PCC 7327]AFY78343.1 GH3 auxin-responsive promoter-binding protein [Pleurocapsa sp. PCC 7327]MBF2022206.1 GH3 auxin-responsive promoter family protein [Hydrococcus sp. C42_A2020_068]